MTTSGSTVGQSNQSFPVEPSTEPDQVQVLVSAHLNLLGERLKEISRNISSVSTICTLIEITLPFLKYLEKGQSPNIDRSLDIILDTVIYSSTALLNLFEAIKEIKALKNNPKTEEEIDQELTKLAIYHLSTGNGLEIFQLVTLILKNKIMLNILKQQYNQHSFQQGNQLSNNRLFK